MKYWAISYIKSYHWIDKKYVEAECSAEAIRKTKLKKTITEVEEISKEYYDERKAYLAKIKQEKKDNAFVQ